MLEGKSGILIVDDDTPVRELLQEVLSQEGFSVLVAQNGPEALDLLASHPLANRVGVAFLDYRMPKMSGLELGRRIKTDPQTKDTKLVLVSATIMKPHQTRDFLAVIRKPFEIDQIIAKAYELSTT
jgi:two-component system, chemotaxis family, chemotaxis protein CheY